MGGADCSRTVRQCSVGYLLHNLEASVSFRESYKGVACHE